MLQVYKSGFGKERELRGHVNVSYVLVLLLLFWQISYFIENHLIGHATGLFLDKIF
jgi:hypothetical protein